MQNFERMKLALFTPPPAPYPRKGQGGSTIPLTPLLEERGPAFSFDKKKLGKKKLRGVITPSDPQKGATLRVESPLPAKLITRGKLSASLPSRGGGELKEN